MEETKIITDNIGKINPLSAEEYANKGGYDALIKFITTPEKIIEIIRNSGLQGRGGAGFPVGVKWSLVRDSPEKQKYVICNADEGEPGTMKDRLILSGNPHSVIEGMVICGIAVGATKGYLYLRKEYSYLYDNLKIAIDEARNKGFIGTGILNTIYEFDIEIILGAGAYICGEETALIESIEGKRGEPRYKPPFPGVSGLWVMPTVINNVETLANIAIVLNMGVEKYRAYGTDKNSGTKLFSLSGNIKNPGVYEFQLGSVTIRDLFEKVGGGCPNNKKLLGVQTGGASGTICNLEVLDTKLDVQSLQNAGAVFGTGDLMFFDEDADILEICRNLINFFVGESCGKCTPCSIGLHRISIILNEISNGNGTEKSIEELCDLATHIKNTSFCGLGQMATTPVTSAILNFREAFESKVRGC